MINEAKHILLAEDDPKDVEMTVEALTASNLTNRIDVVRDGVETLGYLHCRGKYANRPGGTPVMVILDLKMPKMDGLKILGRMREDELMKKIPVMILTSSSGVQDYDLSHYLGASAYVVKPVFADGFQVAVKKLGLCWTVVDNPAQATTED